MTSLYHQNRPSVQHVTLRETEGDCVSLSLQSSPESTTLPHSLSLFASRASGRDWSPRLRMTVLMAHAYACSVDYLSLAPIITTVLALLRCAK